MNRHLRIAILAAAFLALTACGPKPTPQPSPTPPAASPTVTATPTPSPTVTASPSTPTAVPAANLNPDVTQASISRTICVSGWTATVRPPVTYTSPLKIRQLAASHAADQNPADYEEDHWIPLELGGAPYNPGPHTAADASLTGNLWPELRVAAGGDAERKDQAENDAKAAVCAGRETLAAAQLAMYTQWGPKQ